MLDTDTKPLKTTLVVPGKIKLENKGKKDCHIKTLEDEYIFHEDWPFYSIITVRDERW